MSIRTPSENPLPHLPRQFVPIPVSDLDRDVLWIDGYFVTWPSGDAAE